MKVRGMIQEFMDDFLGLYISPKNRLLFSFIIFLCKDLWMFHRDPSIFIDRSSRKYIISSLM